MARHLTLDQGIEGSNPSSSANLPSSRWGAHRFDGRSHRLVVRTPASHVGNAGSTPAGITKARSTLRIRASGLERSTCDARMHHMKRASVRDLRYHFPEVERLLQQGESIEITKRKQVIARLSPARTVASRRRPDFLARLRSIYGDRVLKVSSADLLARERDRF